MLSEPRVLAELRDRLLAVPDATPDDAELRLGPSSSIDEANLAQIAAYSRGPTPCSIEVEVAPGCSTMGYSEASIGTPAFEKAIAEFTERVRARNPKVKLHAKPKILRSDAAIRRDLVRKRRDVILELYGQHKPTLQRLVTQYRVDEGWEREYGHTWQQHSRGLVVLLKGARDWLHTHTFQAGVVGAFLKDPHAPFPGGHVDGLEAALLCDYVCVRCKGDALRMIDALLAKMAASSPPRQATRRAREARGLRLGKGADARVVLKSEVVSFDVVATALRQRRGDGKGGSPPNVTRVLNKAGIERVFEGGRPVGVLRKDIENELGLEMPRP